MGEDTDEEEAKAAESPAFDLLLSTDRLALPAADPGAVAKAAAELAAMVARACGPESLTLLQTPPPPVTDILAMEEAARRRAANLPPAGAAAGRGGAGAADRPTFVPPEVNVLAGLLSRATSAPTEAASKQAGDDFVWAMQAMRPRARIWLGRALLAATQRPHEAVAVVDVLRRTVAAAAAEVAAQRRAGKPVSLRSPVALRAAADGGVAGVVDDLLSARVRAVAQAMDDAAAAAADSEGSARPGTAAAGGASALASAAEPLCSIMQLTNLLLAVEAGLESALPAGRRTRAALQPGASFVASAGSKRVGGTGSGGRRVSSEPRAASATVQRGSAAWGSTEGQYAPCLRATLSGKSMRARQCAGFVKSMEHSLRRRQEELRAATSGKPRLPASPEVLAAMAKQAEAAPRGSATVEPASLVLGAGRAEAEETSRLMLLESALQPIREALCM